MTSLGEIYTWKSCICPGCGTVCACDWKPTGDFEIYCTNCHSGFRIAPLLVVQHKEESE